MSESREPLPASAAPETGPRPEPAPESEAAASVPPAPAAAPAPAGPARPHVFAKIVEWFWRGSALRNATTGGVFVPPRARELDRRARVAADLARRALEPSAPLPHGTGDAVAGELYREALFWSLSALAVTRGEAEGERALLALFQATDRGLLLRAAPDPDTLSEIEASVGGASFASLAELAPEEQRTLAWRLRRFVEALLSALDTTQRQLDDLRLQRFTRVGTLVVLLFVAVPITFLVGDWSEQRRDIGVGKPWKASSQRDLVCQSPEQKCAGSTQGFFFHTNEEESPWFMIDLGSKKTFSEVRVSNRTDCCPERVAPLVIEVSNDKNAWNQVATRSDSFDTWKATFPDTKARYVRLRVTRRSFLHLSAVRVLR